MRDFFRQTEKRKKSKSNLTGKFKLFDRITETEVLFVDCDSGVFVNSESECRNSNSVFNGHFCFDFSFGGRVEGK